MPWSGASAELDFILADQVIADDRCVITRAGVVIARLTGMLKRSQVIGTDGASLDIIGRDVTFTLRDGTEGATRINDVATIADEVFSVRNLGERLNTGLRVFTLAGGD